MSSILHTVYAANLALASLVVPVMSDALSECVEFNVESIFGDSYVYQVAEGRWAGQATVANPEADALGDAINAIGSVAPTITVATHSYADVVAAVGALQSDDEFREWEDVSSQRTVYELGDTCLTKLDSGGHESYFRHAPGLKMRSAPSIPQMQISNPASSVGLNTLKNSHLAPFPGEDSGAPSWIETGEWETEVGDFEGRQRVRLSSVNGIAGEPGTRLVLLFERVEGVMLPIVYYAYHQETEWEVRTLEYDTHGGLGLFPSGFTSIRRDPGGYFVGRDSIDYLGAPSSIDTLDLPFPAGSTVMVAPGALSPSEAATFKRDDISTWPTRIIDALEVY